MRVLVVDDNALSRAIAADALAACGFDAVAVESGEALEKTLATGEMPDLVLLDIVLQGADGVALCQQLKADARYGHLPVVFLSSQPADIMEHLARLAGADGYLTKAHVTDHGLAEKILDIVTGPGPEPDEEM